MAVIPDEKMNIILERGFQGTPFPIIPTPAYRRSQGNATFYQTDNAPQSIYNLGDAYGITQGLYVINQEVWKSAVTVESDDYYNTFNSIKLVVDPTGGADNVDIYAYMMNDFTTTLPTTVQQIDIKGDIPIGTDLIKLEGNMHLTLLYVDFDGSSNNVLRLALHCDNAHYYSASGTQYDFDMPNYCIFMNQTQFIVNQPWAYLVDQGDPSWYDTDTQVPPISTGGGGGGFFRPSDTNWFSGIPALDILSFGMVSQYQVTASEAETLGRFLWSANFVDNILKGWQSPFENIINMSFVPLNTEIVGTSGTIKIGNVDTLINSKRVTKSIYEKSFGSINMKELYRNFADYSPFTKLSMYLPGCGIKILNPDDYMDGQLHLTAYIDIFSGTIVYQTGSIRHGRQHIVDHYEGNIQTSIPITGANYASAYQSAINGLAQMGSGNVIGAANSFLNVKPDYGKASGVSGSAMRLSLQKPYIFFDTPQLRAADNYRSLHGYVSNQPVTLSECKGYTEVKYMDLRNIDLTDDEKSELEDILTSGVYIN